MHYRDDEKGFGFDVISRVDDFVNAMGSAEFKESSSIEIESTAQKSIETIFDDSKDSVKVVVLEPSNR